MKKQADVLKKVLDKYRMTESLPGDIQKQILNRRKESLAEILKKERNYNYFTGFLISLNIIMRRAGLRFSQSRLTMTAAAASMCAAIILIAAFIIIKPDYFPEPDSWAGSSYAIMVSGNINCQRPDGSSFNLRSSDRIFTGSILTTGKETSMAAQLGIKGIIFIGPETSIELKIFSSERKIEVFLKKGFIISNISGFEKDFIYSVTTPNASGEVRGTEFSVYYNNEISLIALSEGIVNISHLASGVSRIINRGYTAEVSRSIKVRSISPIEQLEIKKISGITIDHDLGKRTKENFDEYEKEYQHKIFEINREIEAILLKKREESDKSKIQEMELWKKLPPLERLKREGKNITMFYLKNGSKIAGSIISQDGKEVRIDTGVGFITIPKSDITRRESME